MESHTRKMNKTKNTKQNHHNNNNNSNKMKKCVCRCRSTGKIHWIHYFLSFGLLSSSVVRLTSIYLCVDIEYEIKSSTMWLNFIIILSIYK